ncbi:MAG: DUF4105 domain-containing protein [Deltaproteobacteria bacterium]|nr:DUF4105 domain-containing protein [Deltaproteobacteria bacterium]
MEIWNTDYPFHHSNIPAFQSLLTKGSVAMKFLLRVLLGILVSGMTAWSAGAIYHSPLPNAAVRFGLAGLFIIATALAFLLLAKRRRTLIVFFVVFAIIVGLYFQIPASNDRDWQPEVAYAPYATIKDDLITIHNIRNFDYRTETDFTPRWETRTYDLRKLDSADLIPVYWADKAIAHIMVSFGFGGKDYVAVSIETRKEKGESYSTIAGFFRQYELVYVVADERDVIGVRTTYRQPPGGRVRLPDARAAAEHPAYLSRLCQDNE